jgi:hypothetical protein
MKGLVPKTPFPPHETGQSHISSQKTQILAIGITKDRVILDKSGNPGGAPMEI